MNARTWPVLLSILGACTAPTGEPPPSSDAMAWNELRNPVLGFPDLAIKDAYAIRHDGRWHLGYSRATEEPFRFRVGLSHTADWKTFTHDEPFDDPDVGGLASPTVVRMPDGRFVMTYNSHTRDVGDTLNKLYYRVSDDMVTWSPGKRIHIDGVDGPQDRLIDISLAFADAGIFLFFKLEQSAQVAYTTSGSLDGPWTHLGPLNEDDLENCQPIQIDGVWHLLATGIPVHDPILFRLAGDANDPQAWRTWTRLHVLEIPPQSWNVGEHALDHERANAAFLIDERAVDGFFYLLFAGSTEVVSFEGRGHARLGLARSTDLLLWDVPPEP